MQRYGITVVMAGLIAGACGTSPGSPSRPATTLINGQPLVGVPGPIVEDPGDPIHNTLACKWRDEVGIVRAFEDNCPGYVHGPAGRADLGDARACTAARIIPTTWGLTNGHAVYIEDTGRPPYYRAYDYPSKWCGDSPGYIGFGYAR